MPDQRKDLTQVPNRRGRPRLLDPQVPVTTWIPSSHYDRIAALARKNNVAMSAVLRNIVILRLQDK